MKTKEISPSFIIKHHEDIAKIIQKYDQKTDTDITETFRAECTEVLKYMESAGVRIDSYGQFLQMKETFGQTYTNAMQNLTGENYEHLRKNLTYIHNYLHEITNKYPLLLMTLLRTNEQEEIVKGFTLTPDKFSERKQEKSRKNNHLHDVLDEIKKKNKDETRKNKELFPEKEEENIPTETIDLPYVQEKELSESEKEHVFNEQVTTFLETIASRTFSQDGKEWKKLFIIDEKEKILTLDTLVTTGKKSRGITKDIVYKDHTQVSQPLGNSFNKLIKTMFSTEKMETHIPETETLLKPPYLVGKNLIDLLTTIATYKGWKIQNTQPQQPKEEKTTRAHTISEQQIAIDQEKKHQEQEKEKVACTHILQDICEIVFFSGNKKLTIGIYDEREDYYEFDFTPLCREAVTKKIILTACPEYLNDMVTHPTTPGKILHRIVEQHTKETPELLKKITNKLGKESLDKKELIISWGRIENIIILLQGRGEIEQEKFKGINFNKQIQGKE